MVETLEKELIELRRQLAALQIATADKNLLIREIAERLTVNADLLLRMEREVAALIEKATAATAQLAAMQPKFTAGAEAKRDEAEEPDRS